MTPSDKLSLDQNYNVSGYQRTNQPTTPLSYADLSYSRSNVLNTPINNTQQQQAQIGRDVSKGRVRPSPDTHRIKW